MDEIAAGFLAQQTDTVRQAYTAGWNAGLIGSPPDLANWFAYVPSRCFYFEGYGAGIAQRKRNGST